MHARIQDNLTCRAASQKPATCWSRVSEGRGGMGYRLAGRASDFAGTSKRFAHLSILSSVLAPARLGNPEERP
jgi:hypothetical protein